MLIISVNQNINVNIGILGNQNLEKGYYIYVGSAQTNLEKRILHHNKLDKKKFWHIDYLMECEETKISNVFYKKEGKQGECKLADNISKKCYSIRDFGSSDCKCKSHLFRIKNLEDIKQILLENEMLPFPI
jgi:Uri superfamily endonuclease